MRNGLKTQAGVTVTREQVDGECKERIKEGGRDRAGGRGVKGQRLWIHPT